MRSYDLIVIGAGAGGLTVAKGAAAFGATVALVEKKSHIGGDCLHYGCIPSKTLVELAKKVHDIHANAKGFGLEAEGQLNLSIIMEHVQDVITHFHTIEEDSNLIDLGIDLYKGHASFVTEHQIEIDRKQRINGKRFVIATGSSPIIPDIKGIENTPHYTNETIYQLDKVPNRLVVIGGGPTNLELGQCFARFGSDVTILDEAKTFLAQQDEEIALALRDRLTEEMSIHTNSLVVEIEELDVEKKVKFLKDGNLETIVADEVLVGVGRQANTSNIGLNEIGVQLDNVHNVLVNPYLQTSKPHIYAIGDVHGKFCFSHAAGVEGKVVVQNAVLGLKKKIRYDNIPYTFYTDPEIFHIGMTEKEAIKKYGKHNVGVLNVQAAEIDRFITSGDEKGFVKVIISKRGKILGAQAIGKHADDWMQALVFAKTKKYRVGALSTVVYPYPSNTGILQAVGDTYWRQKFHTKWSKWMKRYTQIFR
ncbi:dihydrolipoyl dehydrogenase family protein [Radiobacillus deserti]|uniref:Pyridine nucleotide-disulfide oxidoreductase n=1 Tax=Radiobacillus deserti TaxID=2594883 RepID=A0A516KIX8_9BACI|nr:FAD-dependent oxidoreductase [Radiobacillus deserti]QDP41349.1 pyridine nucleotide-disulfide oxidoreductase [Radiobacillus deserti]